MDFCEIMTDLNRLACEPGPYLEGREARLRNQPITSNPYRPWPHPHPFLGTAHSRWAGGWEHEDAEAQKAKPRDQRLRELARPALLRALRGSLVILNKGALT